MCQIYVKLLRKEGGKLTKYRVQNDHFVKKRAKYYLFVNSEGRFSNCSLNSFLKYFTLLKPTS